MGVLQSTTSDRAVDLVGSLLLEAPGFTKESRGVSVVSSSLECWVFVSEWTAGCCCSGRGFLQCIRYNLTQGLLEGNGIGSYGSLVTEGFRRFVGFSLSALSAAS